MTEDGRDFRLHEVVPTERPERTCFVDGVMRTEARLTRVGGEGETRIGLAGSWAAGAVVLDADRPARVAESDVLQGRMVVFSRGEVVKLPRHKDGGRGRPWPSTAKMWARPGTAFATRCRRSGPSSGADGSVVAFDGPLRSARRSGSGGGYAIGYVKTHHRRTLAVEQWRQVPKLRTGQRTSLFAMPVGMYACYVRVGMPGPWARGWAGIARLEIPQDAGLEAAAALLDRAAAWLPQFATPLHRNARAPVNLTPVAGLEQHLRRLLGSSRLAVRAVRESVMELNRNEHVH